MLKISAEKLKLIKNDLKEKKIPLREVADKANVSERSVRYFFAGRNYSSKVKDACIQLIIEHNKKQIKEVQKTYQNFLEIVSE